MEVRSHCPKCGGEVTLNVTKYFKGKQAQTSGPPDSWAPPEPAEILDYEVESQECDDHDFLNMDKFWDMALENFAENVEDYELGQWEAAHSHDRED